MVTNQKSQPDLLLTDIETRLTQRFSQLESDLRKEQLTCKIKFAVLICGLFALQWILL